MISKYLNNNVITEMLLEDNVLSLVGSKIALHTSNPTVLDTGIEVSTDMTNYARLLCEYEIQFDNNGVAYLSNIEPVSFNVATSKWGTITHISIRTQDDNMLLFGALVSPATILTGDQLEFGAGEIRLYLE